jgi:NADH:ubiquinone reductase (H+-translocating)
LSPADIAIPILSMMRGQRNVDVHLGEVVGVDTAARSVVLANRQIPFDYLIIATGAQHSYFGRDELAGSLAELARTGLDREYRIIDPVMARVVLVQSAACVLPTFAPRLSAQAERSLHDLGVEVRTGAKVTHIDRRGVEIDGERIAARTMFWAAGVAASPAAKWLGGIADRSGRVVVNGDLSVPGCPGVFAIGDTAASNGWAGATVPGLASAAKQEGRHVARVIRAAIKGHPSPGIFRYRHHGNPATIGRLAAVVELPWIRLWGAPAWWFWGIAHVLLLAGGRNRAVVVLNWLWVYLTYRRSTRLITDTVDT